MDLGDSASAMPPVQSQTIIVKPENQANITKQNGSRNIKVFIPPHLGYWLPSQSDFHFNIKMKGRGQPIPSRDAGCHSLFLNIRSWDGTGTHLLESVEQYNTYVAQCYNYNKTQALSNDRAEFQGVQANKALDQNLFWALDGGTNWSGGVIDKPNIARSVQFVSPFKTKLYDTDEYVPVECLGGVRLEAQLDNYLRSLEYTTGSLAIGADNGLPAYPLAIMPSQGEYPALVGPPAQTALPQFIYSGAGTAVGVDYVAGNSYAFGINGATPICGYIKVLAVAGSGGLVVPGNLMPPTQQTTGATPGAYPAVATTVAPAGGSGATLNITIAATGLVSVANVAVAGSGYSVGDVLTVANGLIGGGGQDATFTLSAADIAGVSNPTQCEILCLGEAGATSDRPIPVAGDILHLEVPTAITTPVAKLLRVADGANCVGAGRVANRSQNIHLPLWSGNGTDLCNLALSYPVGAVAGDAVISPAGDGTNGVPPNGAGDDFGDNPSSSLRNPRRDVAPRASTAYDPTGCFPATVMPFSVGDSVYVKHLPDPANPLAPGLQDEALVGCVSAIDEYKPKTPATPPVENPSGMPRLLLRPDVEALQATPAAGGAATPYTAKASVFGKLNAAVPPVPTPLDGDYAYTRERHGLTIYTKEGDRVNGWTPKYITSSALVQAAQEPIDFEISDFQYQVKQIMMPEQVADREMAATNSEAGLQIDLETIATRQVNLAAIQGPTSQLISLPNISRGLGVLSVPLNQNEQRGLEYSSLRGAPDNATDYQWELGVKGLCPNRPVPVEKASFNNPLVQSQFINENMKALDSFGVPVSNLNNICMNWSVGRQFARPQQFFDLARAGDLLLKMQFNQAQTYPKLFVHFINHLRSINISKNGIQIMN
tara:strand:+ start:11927 stop:14578 length:2652 start_codon:yes stop_codon:yes gene_type:complete